MEVPGKIIEPNEERRSSNDGDNECESCKEESITTPANGYCKDCREYMCNTCFRHHLKAKSCRHHILVDIDLSSVPLPEGKEAVVLCKQHIRETVRFYCRKHEVVGCGDCMILEHNACNSEYIKNLSDKFQQGEEFNTLIRQIENITVAVKVNENKLKENEKDNKLMLKKALGDIRKFRAEFNKYLDKVEADVISEAKRIVSDNDKLLTKLEQDCKQLSSKIEKMKQMLNTDVYTDNELFINNVEYKPKVKDIEAAVTQMQSQNMRKFEFVRDEQLRNIISSRKKLGTLAISSATSHHQTIEATQNKSEKTRYVDNTDKKEKDVKSAAVATVGARVRHNASSLSRWVLGTGTVTAVHPDGQVDVRWYSNGVTNGPHTVGAGGRVSLV